MQYLSDKFGECHAGSGVPVDGDLTYDLPTRYEGKCYIDTDTGMRYRWNETTDAWDLVNGGAKTITPIVTGPSTIQENISADFTITNYDPTYTYTISVSQGIVLGNGAIITWKADEVVADIPGELQVSAHDGSNSVSDLCIVSVTIEDLPSIEDQVLIYDSGTMAEFTGHTDTSVIGGELIASGYNGVATSNIITQNVPDLDFDGLTSDAAGSNEDFTAEFEFTTIANGASTADTLVTDCPIADGDRLIIKLTGDTLHEIVAAGVTGAGPWTMDTTAITAGEIPLWTYILDSKVEFEISGGFIEAAIDTEVNTLVITPDPMLKTVRHFVTIYDAAGSPTIQTKVSFRNINDKLIDLRATITKKV